MNRTSCAVELADYLSKEAGEDGAHLGLSDIKVCVSALKTYARLRKAGVAAMIAALPLVATMSLLPEISSTEKAPTPIAAQMTLAPRLAAADYRTGPVADASPSEPD